MRAALGEEGGGCGDCPVCAPGELPAWQAREEAVHGAGEFGHVGRDGGVDGGEREGEFGVGGEAGGEGCCVGLEVVDWLLGLGR